MKTQNNSTKILTGVILLIELFFSGAIQAQMKDDATLLLFNAAYGNGKNNITGETMDGWGFSAAFEKINWEGKYALGFAVGWISYNDDSQSNGFPPVSIPENPNPSIYDINTFPFYFYGKLYFGNPRTRFYIGGGLGAYVSKIKVSGDNFYSTTSSGGVALSAPLGFYLFASENVFFNVNYVFNWLSDSPLDNNIAHILNLGIGFQFP